MISGLEPAKISLAVAHTCSDQEPLKVQLPAERLTASDFSLRLQEAITKEQQRLLSEQNHHCDSKMLQSVETSHTRTISFTLPLSEECKTSGSKPRTKSLASLARTSISDLSTNASPCQSDDEEDNAPPQTTIVMKNLSQLCTRNQLVELLDSNGFQRLYDLVYLPVDFGSMLSNCYAFVNFVSEQVAVEFQACASLSKGFVHSACVGEGGCEVSWASGMQGLQAAIEKYRNSPVMHANVPDECKPLLLRNGKVVAFPKPTKKIIKPRGLQRKVA